MSLADWKAEFYPEPAEVSRTDKEAVEHSLRKWKGLLLENLEKHGVNINEDLHIQASGLVLRIDSTSCSLCYEYYAADADDNERDVPAAKCGDCPLAAARGASCDQTTDKEPTSPWNQWRFARNPRPMIDALEQTLKGLP